jgi:penicillin-binding protein 1A
MTNAYGVFAQDGVFHPHRGILEIQNSKGETIYQSESSERQALDTNIARTITSILSDNVARIPTFGTNSPLMFPGREVAAKTGTTDDYHDVWVIGYTPNVVVGAWAGNNHNTPIAKKIAGLVIVPMWRNYMDKVLPELPNESFNRPEIGDTSTLKPVFRGIWQGGVSQIIDKTTGLPATETTLPENKEEKITPEIHSILYWVNKNDPLGPAPSNPSNDPQYNLWETPIQVWVKSNGFN